MGFARLPGMAILIYYSGITFQTHEKHCRGDMPSSPVIPSPEPELVDDEPEPAGQVREDLF